MTGEQAAARLEDNLADSYREILVSAAALSGGSGSTAARAPGRSKTVTTWMFTVFEWIHHLAPGDPRRFYGLLGSQRADGSDDPYLPLANRPGRRREPELGLDVQPM